MIPAKRKEKIVNILQREGSVSVTELGQLFGVSEMTIRRDLEQLEADGLLIRTHGGAVPVYGRSFEPSLRGREQHMAVHKAAIAKMARTLVNPGDSIAIDAGTTASAVARSLKDIGNLTVVTNNIQAAIELGQVLTTRVVLVGGIVRCQNMSMVGASAARSAKQYRTDKAFISGGALSRHDGLTDPNIEENEVKRALIEGTRQVIVVVDSSKLDKVAFARVCQLSEIHTLITDSEADPAIIDGLQSQGVKVLVAPLPEDELVSD